MTGDLLKVSVLKNHMHLYIGVGSFPIWGRQSQRANLNSSVMGCNTNRHAHSHAFTNAHAYARIHLYVHIHPDMKIIKIKACKLSHFPIGILGQLWYLIVSIPYLCTLT